MARTTPDKRRILDWTVTYTGVINRESRFEGVLSGKGNYVVMGTVVGDARLQGTVMIHADAQWTGDIDADVIIVSGRLHGAARARRQIEVTQTGCVTGTLSGPFIAIEETASIEGDIAPDEGGQLVRYRERRGR
jgi:cytoskeletal protein CcmA (bactofilin family)